MDTMMDPTDELEKLSAMPEEPGEGDDEGDEDDESKDEDEEDDESKDEEKDEKSPFPDSNE